MQTAGRCLLTQPALHLSALPLLVLPASVHTVWVRSTSPLPGGGGAHMTLPWPKCYIPLATVMGSGTACDPGRSVSPSPRPCVEEALPWVGIPETLKGTWNCCHKKTVSARQTAEQRWGE